MNMVAVLKVLTKLTSWWPGPVHSGERTTMEALFGRALATPKIEQMVSTSSRYGQELHCQPDSTALASKNQYGGAK